MRTVMRAARSGYKMELQVEYVSIDSIKPYEGNAKEHPQEQIEQIKKSIRGRDDRQAVLHHRARPEVCRCYYQTLGRIYRQES